MPMALTNLQLKHGWRSEWRTVKVSSLMCPWLVTAATVTGLRTDLRWLLHGNKQTKKPFFHRCGTAMKRISIIVEISMPFRVTQGLWMDRSSCSSALGSCLGRIPPNGGTKSYTERYTFVSGDKKHSGKFGSGALSTVSASQAEKWVK